MFVRNLPPVPEGFDPDTIQFGSPPNGVDHAYFHILDRHWYQSSQSLMRRIYCLKFNLWYPPEWYDSNGDLLPDVYEYDNKSNKWPDSINPLDLVSPLYDFQRKRKERPFSLASYPFGSINLSTLVAYVVTKRV